MTRDVGQLTPAQTITGLIVFALAAYAIATALDLLIDIREITLDAPAENRPLACDDVPAARGGAPDAVTSNDLLECPRAYDGLRVSYTGEAVRAVLRRGERAWVQLNDDPYGLAIGPLPEHRTAVGGNSGIPVSIPSDVAEAIAYVGDHTHLGDVLEVSGTYRRADPSDGGGPTITADTATITRRGRDIHRPVPPDRLAVAALLLGAAGTFYILGSGRPNITPTFARRNWPRHR